MTDQELAEFLRNTRNRDNALLALREANFRKDKVLNELIKANADLTKRLAFVEEKTLKKAGCRTIYVVSSALELFAKVKEHNVARGYSCEAEDYIFLYRGNRITSKSISNKYKKYCEKLGIVRKSNHKERKTCLTKIADNPNINLKDAMQYSGHKDVKTYIKHYCFSRYSDEHQRKELKKCLNM